MRRAWKRTVGIMVGATLAWGGSGVGMALAHEGMEDQAQLRSAQEAVKADKARISQHKQAFQQQMASLKNQRAQALKAKNKTQAQSLTQQIQQLKEQYRAQKKQDCDQLCRNQDKLGDVRRDIRKDKMQMREQHWETHHRTSPPAPVR